MRGKFHSIWLWMPGSKCLTNDEASLTWQTIQNVLWVCKNSFVVGLVESLECVQCGEMEEPNVHIFFPYPVMHSLYELIISYMVCMLHTGCQFCL